MIDYVRTDAEQQQERIDRVPLDGRPELAVSERRGAGVVIDSEVEPFPFRKLVGRDAKVKLQITGEEKALNVLGRVVWYSEQHGVTALGIEFTEIPERDRRILEQRCREDDGDQARIMNLWQVLVAEEVQHEQ
jgi:hypothetical protein